MFRPRFALAAIALLAALPAAAQDRGGVQFRDPAAILNTIDQAGNGCRLSNTSVTVGVNRAFTPGSLANQQLAANPGLSGGCRPLVSTQVVAGVNLGLGRGSAANQSIDVQGQRGLLATTNVARGFNFAVGGRSTATQNILSQIGR
jgi:hypothetical protein